MKKKEKDCVRNLHCVRTVDMAVEIKSSHSLLKVEAILHAPRVGSQWLLLISVEEHRLVAAAVETAQHV